MSNKEAIEILKNSEKRSFMWTDGTTDTTELIMGTFNDNVDGMVEKMKHKILIDGNTIIHSNGDKEFIRVAVIHDPSKEGSDAFIWNSAGEKVKHSRERIMLHTDGTEDSEAMRSVFREF